MRFKLLLNRIKWRIAVFIHRGVRRGFCPSDLLSIDELVSHMHDKLFNCIMMNIMLCTNFHLSVLTVYSLRPQ